MLTFIIVNSILFVAVVVVGLLEARTTRTKLKTLQFQVNLHQDTIETVKTSLDTLYENQTDLEKDITQLKGQKIENKVQNLKDLVEMAFKATKPGDHRVMEMVAYIKALDESDGKRDFTDRAIALMVRGRLKE